MPLKIVQTNRFRKDLKLAKARGFDLTILNEVVNKLASKISLEPQYKDHALLGDYKDFRECHLNLIGY